MAVNPGGKTPGIQTIAVANFGVPSGLLGIWALWRTPDGTAARYGSGSVPDPIMGTSTKGILKDLLGDFQPTCSDAHDEAAGRGTRQRITNNEAFVL